MKGAEKLYGQDLKNNYNKAVSLVASLENKINKRYDLIINDYPQYIPEEYKRILSTDLSLNQKMEIIIAAEDNYVQATSNQGDLFK